MVRTSPKLWRYEGCLLPLPLKLYLGFLIIRDRILRFPKKSHGCSCGFPHNTTFVVPAFVARVSVDNRDNSPPGASRSIRGLCGLTKRQPTCMSKLFSFYLKQLPEEHRTNGSIPACKIDVVCRSKTACCPSSDTSCCFRQVCTGKNRSRVGCIGGRSLSLKGHTQTHMQRKREKSTGGCLLFCGNQAEAYKTAFLFLLPLYLTSLHISSSLCLLCFSCFHKSVFPEVFGHHFSSCPSGSLPLRLSLSASSL